MGWIIFVAMTVFVAVAAYVEVKWYGERKAFRKEIQLYDIPTLEPIREGDILLCEVTHSDFTVGRAYEVKTAYTDVPVVYNDEGRAVIATGLSAERFEVIR